MRIETLTLAEVAARTVSASDRNDHAENGRIVSPVTFSVPYEGQERHSAFQFAEDGKPLPIIRDVLAILPPTMTPWQVAFWFVSSNSWLDGHAPRGRLDDVAAIMVAASRESDVIAG